jgi:hypothetical protein
MARILTDESTLTKKLGSLTREDRMLEVISRGEAVFAAVLLVAGVVWTIWKGSSTLLIAGLVVAFLCAAHWMKIRENKREHKSVKAGLKGEVTVTQVLARELSNDTYILNDVTVKRGMHSAQIDHVVVSPKGIFLIETKNWRGKLSGDEKDRQWIQNKGGNIPPVKVSNPVMQNQRHLDVFSQFLKAHKIDWPDVFLVLVMMNPTSEWDIGNLSATILRPDEVSEFISYHPSSRAYSEQEVDTVLGLLVKAR